MLTGACARVVYAHMVPPLSPAIGEGVALQASVCAATFARAKACARVATLVASVLLRVRVEL